MVLLLIATHQVRMVTLELLDCRKWQVVDWLFISSGASLFTCGNLGPTWYICVAVKNKVLIYELNRTKVRYEKKKVSSTFPLSRSNS